MKLNEVLDVFGNESLEVTMTPEQEFEASVESLIDEIDNVMEIRAGLEDMENGAVELAKASCESLLTGLAVREMSIANEDLDFEGLCASFGVQPALFGLEAMSKEEMKAKVREKSDKLKAKAADARERVKNSRVTKALKSIKEKIVAFIKSFFTLDAVMKRTVAKLVNQAKKVKANKDADLTVEVNSSRVAAHLKELRTALGLALEAAQDDRWSGFINRAETTIAQLKEKVEADKIVKVSGADFLASLSGVEYASTKEAANFNAIKQMVDKVVEEEPELGKKLLKWMSALMRAIKTHFRAAVSADIKSLKAIAKGKKVEKKEEATESVAFGIESLDALFGEIERVNAGIEDVEIPEEYSEIGVEGMEIFEEFDSFEETMAAVEAVEEMYIEATIPSQIAALESIAIEKGLNPDNGVSFDLFGNMSAGIEASDEVVENSSEETKKTMKERVKGAGAKVAQMAKSVFAFVKAKFSTGISALKNSLKAIKAGMSDKSPDEIKAFFEENSEACNKIFIYVSVLRNSLNPLAMLTGMFKKSKINDMTEEKVAKLREEMKAALKLDPKTSLTEHVDKQYIDSAIALLTKAEKYSRGLKGSSNFWSHIYALQGDFATIVVKSALGELKSYVKDLGKLLVSALKGAKNLLVKVKDKVKSKLGKKKETEEAPVEA